jgi:proline iminopeptidase
MNKKRIQYQINWPMVLLVVLMMVQCGTPDQRQVALPAEGFIQSSDDIELYYQVRGSGPDTLIMLHGGPGLNFDYLAPDLTPLEEDFTLIYYDQRGAGRSTLISEPEYLTVRAHVADLESVRLHFGFDRMALFGHSWGALLAAYYSIEYPGQLSAIVLSSPSTPRQNPYFDNFRSRIMRWMDSKAVEQLQRLRDDRMNENINAIESYESFWNLFIPGYFADSFNRKTIERMQGNFCSGSEESLRNGMIAGTHTWASIENFDIREQLSEVKVPVLIITGTDDIFPVEAIYEWERAYPYSRLVLLERAGHCPKIERPEAFFRTVTEFLSNKHEQ